MNSIITRTAKISFSNNLLLTEVFDNLEIDAKDIVENYEAAMKLTDGKKFLSLVNAAPFTSITKEGREQSSNEYKYKNTVAQAIIVQSLANRIMVNFIIKFYKPLCPLKLFNNKEDAIEWLNEKWDENLKGNTKKERIPFFSV